MSKYYGNIGFVTETETSPGVWSMVSEDRAYFGDSERISRRFQSTENVNDDFVVSNVINIVADPFANQNLKSIKYAEFMGSKWKVDSVEVAYPRLKLTLGGVYNG